MDSETDLEPFTAYGNTEGDSMKQFLSYFCVGGVSALVEWTAFALLIYLPDMSYPAATSLAFILSTTTNWYLGRSFTFKDSEAYKGKSVKEYLLVFLVSAIGLGFNVLLMYFFVEFLGMNTKILQTVAKVMSTGIVFVWNFLSRKFLIYKE